MPELVPAAPLTPGWHAARRGGVTATDIVTILGLSSGDSPYSLFWRKMQQAPEVEDNDRFRLGRALEPYIMERWNEVCSPPSWTGSGLWRHSSRTWQLATLDRMTSRDEPIELKSWADADKHSWQDGPPARVRAQVLWQMDVMDVAVGHVGVVFLPSGEFRSYTIEHDKEHCTAVKHADGLCDLCAVCTDLAMMREAGSEFMARLRLELPPPDPDSSAATLAAVRARFARQPDKQADIDGDLIERWSAFKDVSLEADRKARGLEILIREQAGEASLLTVNGQPVARRVIVDAQVKAHTRHQDYLKRIKQGDDDGPQ